MPSPHPYGSKQYLEKWNEFARQSVKGIVPFLHPSNLKSIFAVRDCLCMMILIVPVPHYFVHSSADGLVQYFGLVLIQTS